MDCASDISEARSLWQADAYNLVLMDVKREPRNVEDFCTEMASAKPPQRMAFLVGKPEYLGNTPGTGADELYRDPTRTDCGARWWHRCSQARANSFRSGTGFWKPRGASRPPGR